MRTIKFRAWDNKYKQMTRDSFSFDGFDDDCFCDWSALPGDELWYLRDMEIMQFTGLHDKNGKEIYEGDICTSELGIGEIIYYEESGKFVLEGKKMIDENCGFTTNPWEVKEVIGNIYEHSNLLTP